MTDQPAPDSTVEKRAETLASVIGVDGEEKQIGVIKSILGELLMHRKLRQVFVHVVGQPSSGKVALIYSDHATYEEVLSVLDEARNNVIETRYQAKLEAEAKKQEPPHEH